ncbi:C2 calcium-dependent membrane targeting [Macleaya cordata]|uniref:C2 calcium-dependent membrane targeting n=1 Tax=Macleaya cordata TaxID=56857 RepID=A0A200Q0I0_MACCD|nr:C2 calcium-dependent membrane targeting [Macleaya cordata]
MDITKVSIIHHVGIVLALLWILSSFGFNHPVLYFLSLIYLYQVHESYVLRLKKKLKYEERKQANQKRLLSDSETVRWLNGVVEKIWPICMERIASQKILFPIIPWFLEKYKPWTAKEAVVESLYMGRNPPMFTEIRVVGQSSGDDHLVLELGMNFLAADDMSAIIAVKLRKRLGFGMWAKLHMTGMHVEGKVLVGVKFLREWPFLGRVRICFTEPPYFQMTVKPIFNHGLDVTEIPGIAGWIDELLGVAFEQTLVEPNMLVVDMEKFVSSPTENWFSVDEKDPIAFAEVEIIEAAEVKPSDLNGLSDPYVNGQIGSYKFQTKVQKKTLAPKWLEEFKIPIFTWESPNVLTVEVRDKDHFGYDTLGTCSININDLRGGKQRHDMWLPLQNIKMGRLHLAITVLDAEGKVEKSSTHDEEQSNKKESTATDSISSENAQRGSVSTVSSGNVRKMTDELEPINIEGQEQTGIWVHHPGTDVSQTWKPRKGKNRHSDIQIHNEDNCSTNSLGSHNSGDSSSDESREGHKHKPFGAIRRSLRKIGSVFHKSPRKEENSGMTREVVSPLSDNLQAVNEKGIGAKSIMDDDITEATERSKSEKERLNPEWSEATSPTQGDKKGMGKSILKGAERSVHSLKHAVSRKGLKKSKMNSVSAPTEVENDSSDEESFLSSSRVSAPRVGVPVVSAPTEQNIHVPLYDSGIKTEEPPVRVVPLQGVGRTDGDSVSCPDIHGEKQVAESSNVKVSEGNSEAEET